MGRKLVIAETVITGLCGLLGIFGLVRLLMVGGSLWELISIALCIAALIYLISQRNKKDTSLIGIGVVIVVAVVASTLFLTGEVERSRRLRVNRFKGRNIVARVEGKTYEWDGESCAFGEQDLEFIWNGSVSITLGEDGENREEEVFDVELTIDGEPSDHQLMKSRKSDEVYVDIYDGSGGVYLILK